ncbi:hypothetical protein J4437_05305, partial [Candidatus Woesearchaeota archaeon]|nr:hypothetical protein [Candidatus Woesearchaeota archaeon]
ADDDDDADVQTQVVTAPAQPQVQEQRRNSGGGGGGFACVRKWECGPWGQCIDAQQTRTCTDIRACNDTITIRNRDYPVFIIDRQGMPETEQSCKGGITSTLATQQKPAAPILPPVQKATLPPLEAKPLSLWKSLPLWYKIIIPLVIIILLALLVLLLFWHRKKKVKTNINELKDWIIKSKKAGASEDDIRKNLKNTQWTSEEIKQVLTETKS